jgi:hypothetical protein
MDRPWLAQHESRRQAADDVVAEIQRRAATGGNLNSGANRGDWLYAAALRFFGSWRGAVEAAGFAYEAVKLRNLSAEEVLHEICASAAAGVELRANMHPRVGLGAQRHFGSWRAAVRAAGCALPLQRSIEAVLGRIRADFSRGLSLRVSDVLDREPWLYGAARRRFGSWARALSAADPAIPLPRRGRPRSAQPRRRRAR